MNLEFINCFLEEEKNFFDIANTRFTIFTRDYSASRIQQILTYFQWLITFHRSGQFQRIIKVGQDYFN